MPDNTLWDDGLAAELRAMPVPEADGQLEERILQVALAGERAAPKAVTLHSGAAFTAWWTGVREQHGAKLALAASVAAVALLLVNPTERLFHPAPEAQVAAMEQPQDAYTVAGLPLLADFEYWYDAGDEYELALIY